MKFPLASSPDWHGISAGRRFSALCALLIAHNQKKAPIPRSAGKEDSHHHPRLISTIGLMHSLIVVIAQMHFLVTSSSTTIPVEQQHCTDPFGVESREQVDVTTEASSGSVKLRLSVQKPCHGFITSHGYPDEGYVNQKCSLELSASVQSGLVIHLSFVDLDLEERYSRSGQCLRDYIVLTTIDRENREHTSERICGNERPEPVRSMQSRARILFVASSISAHQLSLLSSFAAANSTLHARKRGFKIRYDFMAEATIMAPTSLYYDVQRKYVQDCGGANDPTDLSGELRSPGYPSTYPGNISCNWLLRVAPNRRLYIQLLELELTPTVAECDHASLQLIDGYRHDIEGADELASLSAALPPPSAGTQHQRQMSPTDVRFCGGAIDHAEEGMKSYLSEGNRVIVRFTTRGRPSAELANKTRASGAHVVGFRLLWTEVQSLVVTASDDPAESGAAVASPDRCVGFVCVGGELCVDAADSICVERTRLCINETLRCNGLHNCVENDHSDETYCYSHSPVSMTVGVLVLLLLITLLLVCTFYTLTHSGQQKKGGTAGAEGGRTSGKGNSNGAERRGAQQPRPKGISQIHTNNKEHSNVLAGGSKSGSRRIQWQGAPTHGRQQSLATISGGQRSTRMGDGFSTNGHNSHLFVRNVLSRDELLPPCICPLGISVPPRVALVQRQDEEEVEGAVWEKRKSANGALMGAEDSPVVGLGQKSARIPHL